MYTAQCGRDLGSSAMLSPYIYAQHFQALWSFDSENHISSNSETEDNFFLIIKKKFTLTVMLQKIGKTKYTMSLMKYLLFFKLDSDTIVKKGINCVFDFVTLE